MPQQALEPGAELQWQHGRGGQGAAGSREPAGHAPLPMVSSLLWIPSFPRTQPESGPA